MDIPMISKGNSLFMKDKQRCPLDSWDGRIEGKSCENIFATGRYGYSFSERQENLEQEKNMGQIDTYQIIGNHEPIIDTEEETK